MCWQTTERRRTARRVRERLEAIPTRRGEARWARGVADWEALRAEIRESERVAARLRALGASEGSPW